MLGIESTLIAKIVGGITVVGGIGGGGVYAYKAGLFKSILGEDKQTLLVVQLEETTTTDDVAITNRCILDSEKDNGCTLNKLDFTNVERKFLDLSKINSSNQKINVESDLVKGNYFKLTVNSSELKNLTYDEKTFLFIKYKKSNSTTSFAKVKLIAKANGNVMANNKLILVKTKNGNIDDTSTNNYKCRLKNVQAPVACTAFKFTTALKNQNIKDIDFSKVSSIAKLNELTNTVDNLHLIQFGDDVTNNLDGNISLIEIDQTTSEPNNKKIEFDFVSKIAGSFSSTNATDNKLFLLKDIGGK